MSKGNGKPFVESLADDFFWTITGTTEWSKTYHGKQAVLTELLRPLFSQFENMSATFRPTLVGVAGLLGSEVGAHRLGAFSRL